MRVSELSGREDVLGVLAATLADGWSTQESREVRVARSATANGQPWLLQPLLSVIVAERTSLRARRFIADSFRYTPNFVRAPAQWLLGTALASPIGLSTTTRPVLWVEPPFVAAEEMVILPGNRRVRVFDFARGSCRVMLKAGYDPEPVLNEIRARGGRPGPFPSISRFDPAGHWFEEPIVSGFALPRCPPWRNRARYEAEALQLMADHLTRTSRKTRAADHAAALGAAIRGGAVVLGSRIGSDLAAQLGPAVARLVEGASRLGEVLVADSHGDFQAGNVLVEGDSGRVLLSDWEHAGERFAPYDLLVWGLRSRFAAGFAARVDAFIARGELGASAAVLPAAGDAVWRRDALALFLLEELAWVVHDGLSGPRAALSPAADAVISTAQRAACGAAA